MASDADFNRKSFTTGHTGFGIPFLTNPDRVDVPRSAARALRYLDRYVTVTQGEVFYVTEALAQLEGLERGPGRKHVTRCRLRGRPGARRGRDRRRPGDRVHGSRKASDRAAHLRPRTRHRGSARASQRERARARHRDPAEPRSALDHGVGPGRDQALVPETSRGGTAGRVARRRGSRVSRGRGSPSVDQVHDLLAAGEAGVARLGGRTDVSIGTRIRAVRTLRGLSSSELANQAGVSRGLISQLELDRANPSIETLRRIAAALDSPIAAFFDDEPANGIVVRESERKTLQGSSLWADVSAPHAGPQPADRVHPDRARAGTGWHACPARSSG